MIAVSLAYMLVGKNTIYTSQLATRADSPAHRLQFAFPLLSALTVRQAMSKPVASLRQTQSIAEAATILAEHNLRGAPVLSEEGELLGTLTKADIEQIPMQERAQHTVADNMNRQVQTLHPEETLDTALEELTTYHVSWVPVLESQSLAAGERVVGILTLSQIVQIYRQSKNQDTRLLDKLAKQEIQAENHAGG